MTISKCVRSQFYMSSFEVVAANERGCSSKRTTGGTTTETLDADAQPATLIRLPLTRPIPGKRKRKSRANKSLAPQQQKALGWSDEEHDRFLHALEMYPTGPWKNVAAFVGTRTTRQVMTHAQKYRQKIERRRRGLQIPVRKSSSTADSSSPSSPAAAVDKADVTDNATIATSTTPSPSLPGFGMSDLTSNSSSAVELEYLITDRPESVAQFYFPCFPVAMTADEFSLVAAELCTETETLWANQYEGNQTTAMVYPDIDYFEDPLALMFLDPSSSTRFSSSRSTRNFISLDVVYPAPASMEHTSVGIPYECHL